MTARYSLLGVDFTNAASAGDATGTPAMGVGGFQSMIEGWGNHDALVAADALNTRGIGDLSKLVKITVDVDKSGTWVIADNVQNFNDGGGASGDDWVGKLVFIDATTVWVQINIASTDIDSVDTADGIDNTTQTDQIPGANMTAVVCQGIQIDNNQGTNANLIEIVGVNSSWVEDGTQFKLDGKNKATHCMLSDGKDLFFSRNFDFDDAAVDGLATTDTADARYWVLMNGSIHNCGGHGIGDSPDGTEDMQFLIGIGVDIHSNNIGVQNNNMQFLLSSIRDNTLGGIAAGTNCSLLDCTVTGNGGIGVSPALQWIIDGCVIDDNGDDNISTLSGNRMMVSRNRITNANSGANPGIDANSALINLWNFFSGNSTPVVATGLNHTTYAGEETQITTGNTGYEDAASGKYGTLVGAAGYRTLLTMPDNLSRIAFGRGLPSMILPTIGED